LCVCVHLLNHLENACTVIKKSVLAIIGFFLNMNIFCKNIWKYCSCHIWLYWSV